MKNLLIALVVLVILGALGWFFFLKGPDAPAPAPVTGDTFGGPAATTTPPQDTTKTTLGASAGGEPLMAYHFGSGAKEVVFVGGIHGGYSANTTLVARDIMEYLTETPSAIPAGVKVTVIPALNPDGLKKTLGSAGEFEASDIPAGDRSAGRFNANNVDLNRNFACDWNAKAVWQTKEVSGGTAEFSEPEAQAIKAYVEAHTPAAVVVYYSAAGGVFSSNCHGEVLAATKALTNAYAKAAGYTAHEVFDYYETTGDMTNWLAKMNIPAISVLLTNHTDAEWTKNKAGVDAVLQYFK